MNQQEALLVAEEMSLLNEQLDELGKQLDEVVRVMVATVDDGEHTRLCATYWLIRNRCEKLEARQNELHKRLDTYFRQFDSS